MGKKRTVVYCRVACADETAIAAQEEVILRYADANGYTDCVVYRDNGASGISSDRPGWNALMADVCKGGVKTVLVKDLARVARSLTLFMEMYDELFGFGVTLVTVQDGKFEASFEDWMLHIMPGR